MYLDKSIAPKVGAKKADVEADDFCLRHWQPELVTFLGQKEGAPAVVKALVEFAKTGLPDDFELFHDALYDFIHTSKSRVWLIVDEAASEELEKFRAYFPEEQERDVFHCVLTGSVGIASFVDKRHLEKWTWDLPLLTPSVAAEFAVAALAAKGANTVDLWSALGIKKPDDNAAAMENLGDQLHELFGGVAGYTAELVLALTKGETLSSFSLQLSARVRSIIVKASEKKAISPEALARYWLAEIRSPENMWACVRDAGLCGSEAPRGVIFSMMLKWLFTFAPKTDELDTVRFFRSKFRDDEGLDGCLLELEEIIKLKRGTPFLATRLHLNDEQEWAPIGDNIKLTSTTPQLWTYDTTGKISKGKEVEEVTNSHVVLLPPGFCVLDVLPVLYDAENSTLQFYLVQIARSPAPFVNHDTNETCNQASKAKIEQLLDSVKTAVAGAEEVTTSTSFVMLAPNTEGKNYVAHRQQSDYFFSPPSKVLGSSAPQKSPPGLKTDLKDAANAIKRTAKSLKQDVPSANEIWQSAIPSLKGLSNPSAEATKRLMKGLSARDANAANRWVGLAVGEQMEELTCARKQDGEEKEEGSGR